MQRKSSVAGTKVSFSKGAPRSLRLAWGATLSWMLDVANQEGIEVRKVQVHWHKDLYGRKCPLGEADATLNEIMLCTHIYDKDTIIHELAHLGSVGVHGASWSRKFLELITKYLSGQELEVAMFMACRDYKEVSKHIADYT